VPQRAQALLPVPWPMYARFCLAVHGHFVFMRTREAVILSPAFQGEGPRYFVLSKGRGAAGRTHIEVLPHPTSYVQ